jgi:hypothetical protein
MIIGMSSKRQARALSWKGEKSMPGRGAFDGSDGVDKYQRGTDTTGRDGKVTEVKGHSGKVGEAAPPQPADDEGFDPQSGTIGADR